MSKPNVKCLTCEDTGTFSPSFTLEQYETNTMPKKPCPFGCLSYKRGDILVKENLDNSASL